MPPVLVAIGSAIVSGGLLAAGAVAGIPIIGGALVTGITMATTFAAGLVGFGAATGVLSLAAAVSSWGTVALFASSALSHHPKVGQGAAGTQVNFQADPAAGVPLILGRSGTAGKVVHANTTNGADKNSHLYYLIALSAGVIESMESLTCNTQLCTMMGDGNTSGGDIVGPEPYGGFMDVRWSRGLKPEPAYMQPPGFPADWAWEWTPDHLTSGVACAWWTLNYSTVAFPSGIPSPMWIVRGPPVYDPRKDSTLAGGSGPQRWDDETTWAYAGNDNPFLQALTWCIGRRDNGKLTFGIGAPIEAIDINAFVEGASVCEANSWTLGGEVLSTDSKWNVLTAILQAGGGEPIRLGGRLSCIVRAPRVVIASLAGLDMMGDVSITGSKGRKDRFNQIIPTYRSEDHNWQTVPGGAVTVDAYVTADGELRSKGGTYALVQDAKQAAELACYDIVDAREFEPVVLPLGPKWGALQPGDVISLTEPEFGMNAQQLLIQTRAVDVTTGLVSVTCRSETPGKHDFALGRTASPPPISTLVPLNPAQVFDPDAGSWIATGGTIAGVDGQQVPAIIITGAVDDPNVANVLADIRLQLAPGSFGDWMTTTCPAGVHRIEIRAVVPGGTYNVRVRYKTVRLVEGTTGLDLGLVTVGSMVSGGVTQIGGQTPQDLVDQLNETTQLGLDTSDLANQTAQDLLPVADSADYSKTRIDLIGTKLPTGSVFQLSDTTLYADPTTTWGDYKNSLQAHMGANTSAITTEQTTRANADGALATRIDNLTTTVGGNTASITNLQSSVNGLNAQWVLAVSSTGPGYARVAGIKVAANPTVSSIAFAADQIGFTNGVDNVFPLAVVGGKVYATHFQADDIAAGTITTDKIVANNIDVSVSALLGSSITLTPSAAFVMQGSIAITQGFVEIDIWGNVSLLGSGGSIGVMFDFYIDGTYVQTFGQYCFQPVPYNTVTYRYRHNPGAGTHTYQVYGYKQSGGGPPLVDKMFMKLTNKKTQA